MSRFPDTLDAALDAEMDRMMGGGGGADPLDAALDAELDRMMPGPHTDLSGAAAYDMDERGLAAPGVAPVAAPVAPPSPLPPVTNPMRPTVRPPFGEAFDEVVLPRGTASGPTLGQTAQNALLQGIARNVGGVGRLVQSGATAAANPLAAGTGAMLAAARLPYMAAERIGEDLGIGPMQDAGTRGLAAIGEAERLRAQIPSGAMSPAQSAAAHIGGGVANASEAVATGIQTQMPPEASEPFSPHWFAAQIGGIVPGMAAAVGGAAAGGVVGGPAGAAVGAFAPSLLLEAGGQASEIYHTRKAQGATDEDALTDAFLPAIGTGAASAAIETLGGPEAAVAGRGVGLARGLARRLLQHGLTEGAEEVTQGTIGDIASSAATGERIDPREFAASRVQEGVLGAIAGAGFGGAVEAGRAGARRIVGQSEPENPPSTVSRGTSPTPQEVDEATRRDDQVDAMLAQQALEAQRRSASETPADATDAPRGEQTGATVADRVGQRVVDDGIAEQVALRDELPPEDGSGNGRDAANVRNSGMGVGETGEPVVFPARQLTGVMVPGTLGISEDTTDGDATSATDQTVQDVSHDFSSMTVSQLSAEAKRRGLRGTGSKAALIRRLEEATRTDQQSPTPSHASEADPSRLEEEATTGRIPPQIVPSDSEVRPIDVPSPAVSPTSESPVPSPDSTRKPTYTEVREQYRGVYGEYPPKGMARVKIERAIAERGDAAKGPESVERPQAEQDAKNSKPRITRMRDGLKEYMKGRASIGRIDAEAKREWLREFGTPSSDTGRKLRYVFELSDGHKVSADGALKMTNPDAYERIRKKFANLASAKAQAEIFNALPEDVRQQIIGSLPYQEIATLDRNPQEGVRKYLEGEGHILAQVFGDDRNQVVNTVGWLQEAEKGAKGTVIDSARSWRTINKNAPANTPIVTLRNGDKYITTIAGSDKEASLVKYGGWARNETRPASVASDQSDVDQRANTETSVTTPSRGSEAMWIKEQGIYDEHSVALFRDAIRQIPDEMSLVEVVAMAKTIARLNGHGDNVKPEDMAEAILYRSKESALTEATIADQLSISRDAQGRRGQLAPDGGSFAGQRARKVLNAAGLIESDKYQPAPAQSANTPAVKESLIVGTTPTQPGNTPPANETSTPTPEVKGNGPKVEEGAKLSAEQFRSQLRAVAKSDDEADAVFALVEARAKAAGETVDQYVGRRIAGVRRSEGAPEGALEQAGRTSTDTPEFKRWFGDSKVVDADGKPLVVYKAMYPYDWRDGKPSEAISVIDRPSEFPSFNRGEPGVKIAGFFGSKDTANRFAEGLGGGQAVYQAYLSIKNPYVIDAAGKNAGDIQFGETGRPFRDAIKSGKYDGVIIKNTDDEGTVYVALRPTQIKSVNNRGTFDPANPNILFQAAYHGSPHTFDKFSTSAIGTGEGAQAYGYGLYFAGAREVAEYYRKALARPSNMTEWYNEALPNGPLRREFEDVISSHADGNVSIDALASELKNVQDGTRDDWFEPEVLEQLKATTPFPRGRLYHVDLKPADDEYLLWDRPLSEQSEKVKRSLSGLTVQIRRLLEPDRYGNPPSGGAFYNALSDYLAGGRRNVSSAFTGGGSEGQRAASDDLRSVGIRGIKYLDGSSRQAKVTQNAETGKWFVSGHAKAYDTREIAEREADKDRSYNFVLFDESDVEITLMEQARKGAIEFAEDGRAIIHAFESADVSTLVHEIGHLFRRDLSGEDLEIARRWAGAAKDKPWSRDAEEKFARGFERYLRNGKAPTEGLLRVFAQFKDWLSNIYRTIKGSEIDVKISPEMRGVYDRLFGETAPDSPKIPDSSTADKPKPGFKKKGAETVISSQTDSSLGMGRKETDEERTARLQAGVDAVVSESAARRAKLSDDINGRTEPAIWIDHQLINERGKYEYQGNRLIKVQELNKVGFRRNVSQLIGASGEGNWWEINPAAREVMADIVREQEEEKSAREKKAAEDQEKRRAESDRINAIREATDERMRQARFVKKTITLHLPNDSTESPQRDAQVYKGLAIHKAGDQYVVSHESSGKRIETFSKLGDAKRFVVRIEPLNDWTVDEKTLVANTPASLYATIRQARSEDIEIPSSTTNEKPGFKKKANTKLSPDTASGHKDANIAQRLADGKKAAKEAADAEEAIRAKAESLGLSRKGALADVYARVAEHEGKAAPAGVPKEIIQLLSESGLTAHQPDRGTMSEKDAIDLARKIDGTPVDIGTGWIVATDRKGGKPSGGSLASFARSLPAPPQVPTIKPTRIQPDPLPDRSRKNVSEIIIDLGKSIKQVRTGSPDVSNAIGTYNPSGTKTVVRFAGDLDTTAHELGHALDDMHGVVTQWSTPRGFNKRGAALPQKSPFDDELRSPTFSQTTKKRYPVVMKRAEGVAEYIRAWLINPTAAEAAAPKFTAFFKEKVPAETIAKMREFGDDIRGWAGMPASERTLANVRVDMEKPGIVERLRESLSRPERGEFRITFLDKLNTELNDSFGIIYKAAEFAKNLQGIETLLPSRDPKILIQNYAGLDAKVSEVFDNGPIDASGERVDGVGGIKWLLEPLDSSSPEALQKDYEATMALMLNERVVERAGLLDKALADIRALEAESDGLLGSMDPDDIKRIDEIRKEINSIRKRVGYAGPSKKMDAWVAGKKQRMSGFGAGIYADDAQAKVALDELSGDPERLKRITEAASRYRKFADSILRYARDLGRLSPEQYDAITESNQFYVSFKRVIESEFGQSFPEQGKRLATRRDVVKRFSGSTREVENPYVSLIEDTARIMKEVDGNRAMRSFVDLLVTDRAMYDGPPIDFDQIGRKVKQGEKMAVRIFRDGKPEYWQFEEKIRAAFANWYDVGDTSMIGRVASVITQFTKNTITYSPAFIVRNTIRDPISRAVLSEHGSKPWDQFAFVTPDGLDDFHKSLSEFQRYGGGLFGHYRPSKRAHYQQMKQALADLAGDENTILSLPGRAIGAYTRFSHNTETVGRLSEFKRAHTYATDKLGLSGEDASLYAANAARQIQDYAQAGRFIRKWNRYVLFLNSMVRGLSRTGQGLARDPLRFGMRWALYVGVPTVATYLWNAMAGTDDEERELPAYRRDLFWNIKAGPETWIIIPKPWEMGVVASGISRIIDAARGKDGAFKGYTKSLASAVSPDDAALVGPFRPMIEMMANHNFMTDKPIVPTYESEVALELRKGAAKSSRIGKIIGSALSADPRFVDNFINTQLGGFGRLATKVSDIGRSDKSGTGIVGTAAHSTGIVLSPTPYQIQSVSDAMDAARELRATQIPSMKMLRDDIDRWFASEDQATRTQLLDRIRERAKKATSDLEQRRGKIRQSK